MEPNLISRARQAVDTLAHHLGGSTVALVVALVVGGAALSGKFSVSVTQFLFVVAWLVILIALRRERPTTIISAAAISALILVALGVYFRPETVPSFAGSLIPNKTEIFPSRSIRKPLIFEFGDSGVRIASFGPVLRLFDENTFKIERVQDELKVSTTIRDATGRVVAELVRNEWRVAPSVAFDRNYTSDALEVKNAEGDIVLQVRLLGDVVQLQGEWWSPNGKGVRILKSSDPSQPGGFMTFLDRSHLHSDEKIVPIFEYPSDLHFGKLRLQ